VRDGEWEVLSFGSVACIAARAVPLVACRHTESLAVVDREANLAATTCSPRVSDIVV
jgi:hypothetical protein